MLISAGTSQSIIPPLPSDKFTGRDIELKEMESAFELPKTSLELGRRRIYVLHGTGGMGKTQLALKFLDKNRDRYL